MDITATTIEREVTLHPRESADFGEALITLRGELDDAGAVPGFELSLTRTHRHPILTFTRADGVTAADIIAMENL